MGTMINRRRVYGGKKLPYNAVDMGLPSGTLWASSNIDVTQPDGFAASPFQYECSFFSWGNIVGHNHISATAFDYDWGSVNSAEPWYEGQPYGDTSGNTLTGDIPVNDTFDAARANLGAPWRMPTSAEFAELFHNVKYVNTDGTEIPSTTNDKRVTVNGVLGLYIESKINGARLFFPCSGLGMNRGSQGKAGVGYYWASTWISTKNARGLVFASYNAYPESSYGRYLGFAVRPVI